jgi:hypothetical protein
VPLRLLAVKPLLLAFAGLPDPQPAAKKMVANATVNIAAVLTRRPLTGEREFI